MKKVNSDHFDGKTKKLVHSQTALAALLICVFFTSVVTVFGNLILDMSPPVRLTVFTIGQLMLSGTVILLMRKLEVFDISDFSFKGIGKGLLLAWFGIVYITVSFFIACMQIPENSFIAPNVFYLFIVVLHPFIGTALYEEALYRGLVLKLLLKKYGHSKRGIINACIISSAFFGFFHICNMLTAPVLPTITQIISAAAVGLFCAVIFVRTRKLLIPMLFHGLLNLSTQIFNAIVSPDAMMQNAGAETGTDVIGFIIMTLLSTLPILIAGLVLLRKVKPDGLSNE